MYPAFDERRHWAVPRCHEDDFQPCLVQKKLVETDGVPPDDWTLYFSIDPGYVIAAGLLLAVPPPAKYGNYIVACNELYLQRATAAMFAREAKRLLIDKTIREFIFDFHGGNLRGLASGELPIETYEREFKINNLKCEIRGHRFTPGCDVIEARELAVRQALEVRFNGSILEVGYPKLLVVVDKCPNLVREIKGFKRKKVRDSSGRDVLTDTGNRKANTHAIETLEMAVGNVIQYHKPRPKEAEMTSADYVRQMHKDFHNRIDSGSMLSGFSRGISLGARGSSYN
jgi:hypothetical protein